jgi:hypothetical protein
MLNVIWGPKALSGIQFATALAMYPVKSEVLAKLPSLAAATWASRKQTIADAAKQLTRRMNEQATLNRRLIEAKLKGEIAQTDYQTMKSSINAEIAGGAVHASTTPVGAVGTAYRYIIVTT